MTRPSAAVMVAEGADPSPGSALSAPLALVRVPFQGEHLTVTSKTAGAAGDQPIPLRPLCDRLGVDVKSQRKKLRGKSWATPVMITAVADDGKVREMVAIPLRAVPLWLATIHLGKVAPSARPMLEAFQAEACDVLYRHFLAPPVNAALAKLAADLEQLRGEVRSFAQGRRRPSDHAARVRAYCQERQELTARQVLTEGLAWEFYGEPEVRALVLRRRAGWAA
jgi:hypothetical protein